MKPLALVLATLAIANIAANEVMSYRFLLQLRGAGHDMNGTNEPDAISQKCRSAGSHNHLCIALYNHWSSLASATSGSGDKPPASALSLVNLLPRTANIPKDDITLLTHISASKFQNLLAQAEWWGGPVDVALYVQSESDILGFLQFLLDHPQQLEASTFHIYMANHLVHYPHNVLRNMVMENAASEYFLAMDADFVTTPQSHDSLLNLIRTNQNIRERLHSKWLYVLPAFEVLVPSGETHVTPNLVPRSKQEVAQLRDEKKLAAFHMGHYRRGHGPTNFKKWFSNSRDESYDIEYGLGFEPYVLGYRQGVPKYWTYFEGFGPDKVSWFMELDAAGYKFSVLRDYYVAHMNHPMVSQKAKHVGKKVNRPKWDEFQSYVNQFYGTEYAGRPGHWNR